MRSTIGWPRIFAGVLLVVLGAGFLLQNVTDFDIAWGELWPVILIILGVASLPSSRWLGALLFLLGAAFLVDNLDIVDVDIEDYLWPVALVAVGLFILFGGRSRWRRRARWTPDQRSTESSLDELDTSCIFGGIQHQVTSQSFKGGRVSAVFGSAEIDLRGAALADNAATLHIETVLGSAELIVPDDWAVNVQTSETLGSVEFRRPQPSAPTATLTLTGSCTLGSITVR